MRASPGSNLSLAFVLTQFDERFTDRTVYLVDNEDAHLLDSKTGPLAFIIPGDKSPARWVRRVTSIEVRQRLTQIWRLNTALPPGGKTLARKNYRLWQGNALPASLFRALGLLFVGVATATAAEAPSSDSTQEWRLDFESGILWHFTGSASTLDYVLLPQILSLVGPADIQRRVLGGELVLRSRYSLLLEPILQAPEHHYYGGSAAGLLEWWDDRRTRCLFLTSGGGFGWLDAKGYEIPGGQGQEFNFNWFIYGGGRIRVAKRCAATVGVYYQHVSNGHFDKLDPGVNAIGPMLNASWRF